MMETVPNRGLVKQDSMETPPGVPVAAPRELPILGGHIALDFANTVDDPHGPARHDHAATHADLLQWATRVDLVSDRQVKRLLRAAADDPQREATMRRTRLLRDALNDLFGAIADGQPDVSDPWSRLRPFVVDAFDAVRVVPADGTNRSGQGRRRQSWAWPQNDEFDVVLHPIAIAAAELLVGPDLPRLKRCARCPWLFLDQSKNHSRRWCDMNDCGRAQKIERYVARRRDARRSSTQQRTEKP